MTKVILLTMAALAAHHLPSIGEAWYKAWLPRPRPIRSEWCEQHIRLPREFSAQPGPFTLDGREYQREILDAVDDPAIREIVLVAPPQVGKTELLRAIIVSQPAVEAAPMMLAGPDHLYAREQRQLVYRICDSSPTLAAIVPPERMRNDLWIDLQNCYIFLAWSGSTQRLSGRSCKIVLCSELDRWQASIELATKRTRGFWSSCVLLEGSPVGPSPQIWPFYEQSDRRTYRVPCPECGRFQELRFFMHREGRFAGRGGVAGLQTPEGRWLKPDQGRHSAYYVCQEGCRIESRQKAEMIRRGTWCPAGCDVAADGTLTGTPANPGRRRGYQLSALVSPTVSFGDAAEAYLLSRDTEDGRQGFTNDWLGRAYRPRGKTPRWKDLGVRLAGNYPRGSVPKEAYFITVGADVQADRVYWIARAWGDRCTSWLIDWGCLKRRPAEEDAAGQQRSSDLAQLDGVLRTKWPVLGENPRGLSALAACILGVDCGYRATDVYEFVRSQPGNRVLAIWGDPKITPGILFRPAKIDRNVRTGEPYPEGVQRWGIDTAAYKSELQDRWYADRLRPGAWWLPGEIIDHEDYLRQITNEARTLESLNGRKIIRWTVIDSAQGNHYWDCEVYARALADMITGCQWLAESWPRPAPPEPPPDDEPVEGMATPQGEFSAR